MIALARHQAEIERNRKAWDNKPLLREIYAGFYAHIAARVDERIPGAIVEIGSGIGNLKSVFPQAICTDLWPNPWLDLVCDGYELPLADGSVSHLVMFDVLHHLEVPGAFLREARRVLVPAGKVLIFEPYISIASYPVYAWLHPEPVAWGAPIRADEQAPHPRGYYAAQGNATRCFFQKPAPPWLNGWEIIDAEAWAAFAYLLSGGYRGPTCYPRWCLPRLRRLDACLSRWPRLFGARCLVGLKKR